MHGFYVLVDNFGYFMELYFNNDKKYNGVKKTSGKIE